MATDEAGHATRRLFVTDARTKVRFLVDTGADLCVFPRKMIRGPRQKSIYELSAANGTVINTYGTETLSLNLGLRRSFVWRFVVADVSKPIIGADFLAHYGLLVDLRGGKLVDQVTSLTVPGQCICCSVPSIKTVAGETPYHVLMTKYPEVTRPEGRPREVKHETRHYIETAPGPPIASRPRRLAPERLTIARKEFQTMVELGVARPSKSSWSSPLHLVQKRARDGDLVATIGR
ncbi:PREDICTED: uncharacterized protein LOC108774366 [Cyphomyrmex costatus]|uniref:uncharacterized protein LOC108774366 n=1 Tax=Cyphomyrmex costatus TaxID=456900 RepID=UPI00085241C9|nr:PREDICTED: uncharacterized protein LOC108774366 [Cyphomyrmex costatus]